MAPVGRACLVAVDGGGRVGDVGSCILVGGRGGDRLPMMAPRGAVKILTARLGGRLRLLGTPPGAGIGRVLLALARHHLGGLHSAHLGNPGGRRRDPTHGSKFVCGVARNSYVVGALHDELQVAYLEDLGAALLSVTAGLGDDIIDEAVGSAEDALRSRQQ